MLSLTYVAHEIHRHGGQERAAAEVLTRLAPEVDLTIVARRCELPGVRATVRLVAVPGRPAVLTSAMFASAAAGHARRAGSQLLQSIGAAVPEADVITAQFCQAAFTARFGGLRGGGGARGIFQSWVQRRFVRDERRAYGARRLRAVIAVSSGVGRELQEHYGVSADLIHVIPNGVDHGTFHPVPASERHKLRAALGLPADRCIALFLGGDWERKGLRDAIGAVAGLPDMELVVVGVGPVAPMQEHAERLGAAAQVRFVGKSTEPQRWYQAADFLLFPSRYEAFSLVTLEAAASGLPIVAHAINGTEDLVADGENGFLSEWGVDALRGHVTRLRDDTALRVAMSGAAVESSRRYAWDRIAAEHLRVLRACAT
ncbi:MAG: glycosyltransferase family 4 protein [Gemmatimonadales bacterium]|nr:glycosyltransferase family 4 protein [Gemmatimonadales bacterium]